MIICIKAPLCFWGAYLHSVKNVIHNKYAPLKGFMYTYCLIHVAEKKSNKNQKTHTANYIMFSLNPQKNQLGEGDGEHMFSQRFYWVCPICHPSLLFAPARRMDNKINKYV
jgi:hypothetical protein